MFRYETKPKNTSALLFDKVIEQCSKLNESSQIDLIRKLLEGKITYTSVLEIVESGQSLTEMQMHADQMSQFSALVSNLGYWQINTNSETYQALEAYLDLNIRKRLEQSDATKAKVINDKNCLIKFETCQQRDLSIHYAMPIYLGIYAKAIYEHPGLSTAQQIMALKYLHPDNHSKILDATHPLCNQVEQFKLRYESFTHSFLGSNKAKQDDIANYIKLVTGHFLQLELNHRAPINKCIQLLTTLKKQLASEGPKDSILGLGLFGKKEPSEITSLRLKLDDLPGKLELNSGKINDKIAVIKSLFNDINISVNKEKDKTFLRDKNVDTFYKNLSESINAVLAEENEALDIRPAAMASNRR